MKNDGLSYFSQAIPELIGARLPAANFNMTGPARESPATFSTQKIENMQPLGQRLKAIRRELKLSQEALGAQGFVSTPGWIKIENGQRQASDRLIEKLVAWLIREKYVQPQAAHKLQDEFLTLKFIRHSSPFVREMARRHFREAHQGAQDELLIVHPRKVAT